MDRVIDISGIRSGTYVRDAAGTLWFSPVRWNSPVDGLRAYRDDVFMGNHVSSLSVWEQVYGAEAEAVHRAYRLAPGEYVEES